MKEDLVNFQDQNIKTGCFILGMMDLAIITPLQEEKFSANN